MQTLDIEFLITAFITILSMVAAIEITYQYHKMYKISPEKSILKGMLMATSIAHIAVFMNSSLWLVRVCDPSLFYIGTRALLVLSVVWFKVVLWQVRGEGIFRNLVCLFNRSAAIFAAYVGFVYLYVGSGVKALPRLDFLDRLF